jgi:hypothetical protein
MEKQGWGTVTMTRMGMDSNGNSNGNENKSNLGWWSNEWSEVEIVKVGHILVATNAMLECINENKSG